jgi:hypothetical protein
MGSQNTEGSSDKTRRASDCKLDETLEETFPASDPPANTVETGIRAADPETPEVAPVTDNPAESRFELTVNGEMAYLQYERAKDTFTLVHTEVPESIRGHHVAGRLVEAGIDAARSTGLRLVVVCPFARAYMRKQHDRQ